MLETLVFFLHSDVVSISLKILSPLFDSFAILIKDSFAYAYVTNYTFIFTLKLAVCLVFLSAIRGGVPRYRYDFLTKMG